MIILPPEGTLRPSATRSVLDITEFYGPTSGGVRTYLAQKAAWVATQPWVRQTIVVPGVRDAVEDDLAEGSRRYSLRGPRVPGQPPYRFLLATRSARRIVEHERPDVIELGSPGFAPWIASHATRGLAIPMVAFFHSNLPR
ncbi:MAG: glycosyltransferase, partial [Gemmatimonadaceae bacterium]